MRRDQSRLHDNTSGTYAAGGKNDDMSTIADFPCRVCGATDMRLYYTLGRDRRFRHYQCPNCALVNYDL